MLEYKPKKLSDIGDIVTGKTPPTSDKANYGDGYMFISPTELHEGFEITDSEKHITEKGLRTVKSNSVEGTSVLVGCIGWDMGNVAICHEKCVTNQQINSITHFKQGYNPYYVYYWLLTKKDYLFSIASVTRTPILSKSTFQDIIIPIPNKQEQDRITDVLFKIDKKIQCNKRINDNLQHQLKLLYDYWFTQFDFPDENGKPYRASGGAMVWCDALHQNIPVNWNISSLGEICSFKNGINYEKDEIGNKQYKIVNVRNITASQMLLDPNSFDTITLSDKKADKYLIEANDFLIARSGSPGATRLLIPSTIPTIYCGFIICCSTSCELKNYIALTLKKLEIANDTKSSGSILKNVSQDTLKEIMLCIPQSKVLDSFNSKANSIIKAMQVTIEENNTLTALRDWLLPMLMNGQATISD